MKIIRDINGKPWLWSRRRWLRMPARRFFEWVYGYNAPSVMFFQSKLSARVFRKNGTIEDLGVIAENLVTDVFAEYLVDNLIAEVAAFGDFKWHISGTNTAAEDVTDTEATITGATPAPVAGTQVEASSKVYESVATIPYVSTLAIEAHGLINNAVKAGAVLMDHSQFTVINVDSGDSIEFTYQLTVNSGG
jgi:hypothetical protein